MVTNDPVVIRLTDKQAYVCQEVLKAHLEHCKKIKPDQTGVIEALDGAIAEILFARRRSVRK